MPVDFGSHERACSEPKFDSLGTKERPFVVVQHGGGGGGSWESSLFRRISQIFNVTVVGAFLMMLFQSHDSKFGISSRVHRLFKGRAGGGGASDSSSATFADVHGVEEAKSELAEVVDFLRNPQKYTKFGARMPKGVLLVGPPGTGKTLLAKAVAGEAAVPFLYASGSDFDEMFVGVGASRIREMFASAKEQAPAIVFIDEIDAVGSARNPRDPQHARMTLNQLLTEMDGFSEARGIVVIAATNAPEVLDPALLRPGRFDRVVHVSLPDIQGRTSILQHYLRRTPLAKEVDVAALARATPGFSGADLARLVNQAKIKASAQNRRDLGMAQFEAVRDEMLMGSERRTLMSLEERRLTSYHEGGHALVALLTRDSVPVHKATIVARGNALGMVSQVPERDEYSITKSQLIARLDVAMGGRAAEHLVYGTECVTTGASNDFEQATRIAQSMVMRYGMSDKIGPVRYTDEELARLSPELKQRIEEEVAALLNVSYNRAMALLQQHRTSLERIAAALLEQETLNRQEIARLIEK